MTGSAVKTEMPLRAVPSFALPWLRPHLGCEPLLLLQDAPQLPVHLHGALQHQGGNEVGKAGRSPQQ